MLEEGISPKNEWRIPDRSEEGIAIPLLLPEKLPTAFVCNCDATAFKLVQTLKERGIRVPEDISVTGFDDSIYAQLCSPPLTTVAVDTDAIARLAAKRMIKHMNEPQKNHAHCRIKDTRFFPLVDYLTRHSRAKTGHDTHR